MSEKPITLGQLVEVLKGEIAWMRIYPDGQRISGINFMGWQQIRDAERQYGNKTIRKIYPGYQFVMVYLDR